ncbi:ABC transporter ATP-binding protein [Natribacillus halophilus]|uniref:Putative ABC transport system ATP-binding protein n=1 Tax=Natribacillus halophilus TaxID=549003 RepID=A0A1G8S1V4_9BACI|nr:ABC transporter ATP-binding protein [Natribacillus halophilus]SDJ23186.1 putative ABC transport system ATP-binding protein [Natribacillus halophilus]
MPILEVDALGKTYYPKKEGLSYKALTNFHLQMDKGEFIGVMGPSGSGKTTLLNLLATIDAPTYGKMAINGTDPTILNDNELAIFRRRQLGFVFQDFNLLDTLTVRENILLPLALDKYPHRKMNTRLDEIAEQLGITDILEKRITEISGGQQQRTACARAIIHDPTMILADEPTGNLDSKSARQVMDTLTTINDEQGATILTVTHDPTVASYCDRIVFIKDGRFFSEIRKGDRQQTFYQNILDTLSVLGGDFNEHSSPRT